MRSSRGSQKGEFREEKVGGLRVWRSGITRVCLIGMEILLYWTRCRFFCAGHVALRIGELRWAYLIPVTFYALAN